MPTATFEREEKLKRVQALIKDSASVDVVFSELSSSLQKAQEMLFGGTVPSQEITDSIQRSNQVFGEWHKKIVEITGNSALERNLVKAKDVLNRYKDDLEESALREKAMDILEQITTLSYVGGEEFMDLSEIQLSAVGLRREMKERPVNDPDLQALISGEHSYCKLLSFVADPNINSDTWRETFDHLSKSLGTELAVAAARGRIILADG